MLVIEMVDPGLFMHMGHKSDTLGPTLTLEFMGYWTK